MTTESLYFTISHSAFPSLGKLSRPSWARTTLNNFGVKQYCINRLFSIGTVQNIRVQGILIAKKSLNTTQTFFSSLPLQGTLLMHLNSYQRKSNSSDILGRNEALCIAALEILKKLCHLPESTTKKQPLVIQPFFAKLHPNVSPYRK